MAEGYARATGRPGVVLVTSGPGGTNVVTGLTNALMDSTPIVVFTGQVPTAAELVDRLLELEHGEQLVERLLAGRQQAAVDVLAVAREERLAGAVLPVLAAARCRAGSARRRRRRRTSAACRRRRAAASA